MSFLNIEESLVDLFHQEVIPAEGCTEPVALSYCAAKTREILGKTPEKVIVYSSGNIIKNVKSVIVPNSEGMVGIEASVAMGVIAGDAQKELMVISHVQPKDLDAVREYLQKDCIEVHHSDVPLKLYIKIEAISGDDKVSVEFRNTHTNITEIVKNGEKILETEDTEQKSFVDEKISKYSVAEIFEVAKKLDVSKVQELLERLVGNNTAI